MKNALRLPADRVHSYTTSWDVTHVDLHRSAKVQALTKFLKGACREGEG